MARIHELIRQIAVSHPDLAADVEREVDALAGRRAFGLNFERHTPEEIELPGRPVRRGDKVHVLPSRGQAPSDENTRMWRVISVSEDVATIVRHPAADDVETTMAPLGDLVVVAEFRDPIYPGLISAGRIEHGGDEPYHAVINAENFHALQTLMYTHRGAVDLVYIDPPYNTGGKSSWLYNDNYIDSEDAYKHSKWLAFMERRLLLAKELLKPSGAIMVSIGDDEQHRLRMLMDQVFGTGNHVAQLAVEMSTTSGPKTTNAQQGTIVKNVEYVLIYRMSPAFDTHVKHTPLYDSIDKWDANYPLWLNDDGTTELLYDRLDEEPSVRADIERFGLVAESGRRKGSFIGAKGMDVLLAVSESARNFIHANLRRIGRTDTPPVSGKSADVPVGRWIEHRTDSRTYRLTRSREGKVWQIYTLDRNYRTSDDYVPRHGRTVIRGDLWRGFHSDMGHVSTEGGVGFANGKKPLRLIRQLIKWANNSPDALILDFFAGSGTTGHAVMAMNADDGGHRKALLVTNNEVSEPTAVRLRNAGLRRGDDDWEAAGVSQAATMPRLKNAASETNANVEFFALTYEAPLRVQANRDFERISPLLWLRSGSRGRRIDAIPEAGWDVADAYGVLVDLDHAREFVDVVRATDGLTHAFVVTDEERLFQAVVHDLPDSVEPVRLYESYLTNFRFDATRAVQQ